MKEYIEREAAISLARTTPADWENETSVPVRVLKDIPAADVVEVRHGRWELSDNAMSMWNVWVCSECGYRRKEGWMHTENGKKPTAQYCENCMAKMDGGVNDG